MHAAVAAADWDGTVLDLTTGYGAMEETRMLEDLADVAQGRRTLAEFLGDHGYHGRGEGEVANRSWRDQPEQLTALIERFADLGPERLPRAVEADRFREIADEVGALLMTDMAHFSGLVAAGLHPNPVPHSDFVTSTTHKTLAGPRAR